jgi:hypothetical protein
MEVKKKTGLRTMKDRKEIGLELRKTHFSLGADGNKLIFKNTNINI